MTSSAFTPTILQEFREASVSQSGIVTTGTQSFAGAKTFEGAFTAGSSTPANIEHLIQGGPATNNVLTLDNNNASPTYTQIRFKMGGVSRGYVGASATNSFQVVNGAGTQFNGQCSDASAWTFGSSGFTGTHTINGKLQLGGTLSGTAQAWFQTGGTTAADIIADFRTGSNASAMQVLGNSTVLSPFFLSISGVSASNNGNENSTLTGVDGNGTYLVRISGNGDAGYSAVFSVMVTAGGINPFKIQGHATLSLYQVSGSTVGLTTSGVPITQTYSWFFTRIG